MRIWLCLSFLLPQVCMVCGVYSYVGCFRDKTKDRDLNGASESDGSKSSLAGCTDFCTNAPGGPYTIFGLQWGVECYCGTSAGKHGAVMDSECDMPCQEEPSRVCGGTKRNSVYMLPTMVPATASPPTLAPQTLSPPTPSPPTSAPTTAAPTTLPPPTASPPTMSPPTPAPPTASPPTPAPETPAPPTPSPPTPAPPTLSPPTPSPPTPSPPTPSPPTPAPPTPAPPTPAPPTPSPPTPAPPTPSPPTPAPPTGIVWYTATAAPPTRVPRTSPSPPTPPPTASTPPTPPTPSPPLTTVQRSLTPQPTMAPPTDGPLAQPLSAGVESSGKAAAVASASGFGAGPAMRMALLSSGQCAHRMPSALHPTGIIISNSPEIGAVVGNLAITAGFSALCMLLLFAATQGGARLFPTFFLGLDTQGFLRLPSAPLFIFQYFYQSLTLAGMYLMQHPAEMYQEFIGLAVLLVCVGVPSYVFYVLQRNVPDLACYATAVNRTGYVTKWFLGPGEWVNMSRNCLFVQRYASVMRSYSKDHVWYLFIELAASFALSGFQSVEPESFLGCAHMKLACGVLFALLLLLEVYLRPHSRPRDTLAICTMLSLQTLAMFGLAIGFYKEDAEYWGSELAGSLLMGSTAVLCVKILCDIVGELYLLATKKRTLLQEDVLRNEAAGLFSFDDSNVVMKPREEDPLGDCFSFDATVAMPRAPSFAVLPQRPPMAYAGSAASLYTPREIYQNDLQLNRGWSSVGGSSERCDVGGGGALSVPLVPLNSIPVTSPEWRPASVATMYSASPGNRASYAEALPQGSWGDL